MKIYDSKLRAKKEFVSREPKKVSMYVCGITPNNATHLGHAFTYVAFDTLVRLFTFEGYSVTYVQNATDVNDSDDVIKQSKESGQSWKEVAEHWIAHFKTQMESLNVQSPTHYVLATESIEGIIALVHTLIDKKQAYEKEGFIYFDTTTFNEHGNLSQFNTEQMIAISRERGNKPEDPLKKNPLDFVLWVPSHEEPNWKAPWGTGRPGWHIECSAMIHKYLGEQIDIHGGGRDLIFPHHESEIAQSESATGKKPYVNTWMHAGMVMFEGEKMSKSLGNLVLVEDLLKEFSPESIRYLLLSHHYRHPWEYERGEMEESVGRIENLKKRIELPDAGTMEEVRAYLDDDLNTPALLRYLEEKASGTLIKDALSLIGFRM